MFLSDYMGVQELSITATGTPAGAEKGWDTRGRGAHSTKLAEEMKNFLTSNGYSQDGNSYSLGETKVDIDPHGNWTHTNIHNHFLSDKEDLQKVGSGQGLDSMKRHLYVTGNIKQWNPSLVELL